MTDILNKNDSSLLSNGIWLVCETDFPRQRSFCEKKQKKKEEKQNKIDSYSFTSVPML